MAQKRLQRVADHAESGFSALGQLARLFTVSIALTIENGKVTASVSVSTAKPAEPKSKPAAKG